MPPPATDPNLLVTIFKRTLLYFLSGQVLVFWSILIVLILIAAGMLLINTGIITAHGETAAQVFAFVASFIFFDKEAFVALFSGANYSAHLDLADLAHGIGLWFLVGSIVGGVLRSIFKKSPVGAPAMPRPSIRERYVRLFRWPGVAFLALVLSNVFVGNFSAALTFALFGILFLFPYSILVLIADILRGQISADSPKNDGAVPL